jgi:hypothetical protein
MEESGRPNGASSSTDSTAGLTPPTLPIHQPHPRQRFGKVVWLLWLQGWVNAPPLVKEVSKSYTRHNPGWRVVHLDAHNYKRYTGGELPYLAGLLVQHKSDMIRLALLERYGGVWADASMLCLAPLDTWLIQALSPAGFWTYSIGPEEGESLDDEVDPTKPTIWFIAAYSHSYIISKWRSRLEAFWRARKEPDSREIYFITDQAFAQLQDPKKSESYDEVFAALWRRVPFLDCCGSSDGSGVAHMMAGDLAREDSPQLKAVLQARPPYVLKLSVGPLIPNSNAAFAIQESYRRRPIGFNMTHKGRGRRRRREKLQLQLGGRPE